MSFKRVFSSLPTTKLSFILLLALALSLVSRPATAQLITIANPVVNGGGSATITLLDPASIDPEGPFAALARPTHYSLHFVLIAGTDGAGVDNGYMNFFFGEGFSRAWGAVPPSDAVLLAGNIDTLEGPDQNGYTVLRGTFREADYTRRQGIVFLADDTFEITIGGDLGPNEFILELCDLPLFLVKVTNGDLTVNSL